MKNAKEDSENIGWTVSLKAVIKKDDKFLILRRSDTHHAFSGLWDFPGGRLEPDEKHEDCVIREVREETGLQIQPLEVEGRYEFIRENDKPVQFIVYSVEILSGDLEIVSLDENEHSEYRLALAEEIRQLKTVPFIKQYLEENENSKL